VIGPYACTPYQYNRIMPGFRARNARNVKDAMNSGGLTVNMLQYIRLAAMDTYGKAKRRVREKDASSPMIVA